MISIGRALGAFGLLAVALPAGASALEICGETITDLPAFIARMSAPGLPRLSENEKYISVKGSTGKTWTVTKPASPAHPAVICREMMKKNDAVVMNTSGSCGGSTKACDDMKAEFKKLDENSRQNVETVRKKTSPETQFQKP